MSDLQRITADLQHAQRRLSECESGSRGRPTDDSHHVAPGYAWEAQTNARRNDVARLERDYVLARLEVGGGWAPSAVIEAMSRKTEPEASGFKLSIARKDDPIRATLKAMLDKPGFYLSRSQLEELLQ